MIEKYVKIKDFSNYYISNKGNVKNKTGKVLSTRIYKSGYVGVYLYKDGKGYNLYIHRLVAQAFIPNPENLPEINHIDETKKNNLYTNLEWCTRKYNLNYGTRHSRAVKNTDYKSMKTTNKKISVYNKETNKKIVFDSVVQCSDTIGISAPQIRNIISGKTKHTHKFDKYIFSYIKEEKIN